MCWFCWWWWWWWLLLCSAVLHSQAHSVNSHVLLHKWPAFYSAFLNSHWSGVLTAMAWLVPRESAAVSAQVLCTPYNHASCHFMQSHIRKVYTCLDVIWHLHFWQNDRDLLRATAVTRGWNGYRNRSQHRKLTMEKKRKKKSSRRSCRDSNPRPFNHESGAVITELSTTLPVLILYMILP